MSGITVDWRVIRASRQEKRASNRANAQPVLDGAGLPYRVHNGGAHIVVTADEWSVDFWPGTGLWKVREVGIQGRGIRTLISFCKRQAK